MNTCVQCGGHVTRGIHAVEMRLGRRTVSISGEYDRCDACEEIYFAPGEADAALRRASEIVRAEERLLTPEEIKAIRNRVGLTQQQFERLIGAGPKTVARWERGTVIQNGATDTLLRLLRDVPEALRYLLDRTRPTSPGSFARSS